MTSRLLYFLSALLLLCVPIRAAELLPDLIVDGDESLINSFDTEFLPGRTLFRFQSSLPNIGPGPLIIEAIATQPQDDLEPVEQEIRNEEMTAPRQRPVEGFFYNTTILEMIAQDWVAYRIREVLPEDGVGEILRTGQKSSVRITSSRTYDSSLPNYSPTGRITATFRRQGISVGYTDIYTQNLEFQWVDVTGLKQGEYWLEMEVDFANYFEEANEDNNIARIKVMLDDPTLPLFDTHRADVANFGVVDFSELLRVIQLYNAGGLGCAENTDDGFQPGGTDNLCQSHSSDFDPVDWRITLSELLRTVQLFNLEGYAPCENGEDGYCPSP